MREEIRYTLISDGSSDITLLEIIRWLFNDIYPKLSANGQYCDFRDISEAVRPRQGDVVGRVKMAKFLTPFDICFYHRDAESTDVKKILAKRTLEIKNALSEDVKNIVVCVIPIKMMESWLLIDKEAIKKAADNRNYRGSLDLPKLSKLESCQTPKEVLHDLLKQAKNCTGRRMKNFNVDKAVRLVAGEIEDYSPLRKLKAFQAFEADMKRIVDKFIK
jgi:hypothetical protein